MSARISRGVISPSGRIVRNSASRIQCGFWGGSLRSTVLAFIIAACALPQGLRADDEDDEDDTPPPRPAAAKKEADNSTSSKPSSTSSSGSWFYPNTSSSKGPPNDGPGADFRAGFNSGQGPVQDRSLAPIEMFPFMMLNDSLFFSDLRFLPTIDGTFGGNLGTGYRYYQRDWDRILGISGWYDADGTRSNYLQQLGLSLETYGTIFDARANLYLPIGNTYLQTGSVLVPQSTRFVGQQVLFDQTNSYVAAMRGVDAEAGFLLPGKFAAEHGIRIYGGGYFFNDSQGDHITGGSARVIANIAYGLDASVQVTDDNYFSTRGFFNISWTFGPLHRSQLSQNTAQGRFGEHVTRNYTVLATPHSQTLSGVTAVDPFTGKPYVIDHVDSSAADGGTGSVSSPFATIAAAQSAATAGSIIFVHAGSVFHGASANVVMNSGEVLLGDGAGEKHLLSVPGLGSIVMPHSNGALPVLDSANGAAITLANNVQLSGFNITNSSGAGIAGNGVGAVTVHDIQISNSGSDAIQWNNAVSSGYFNNISITNANGNGFVVNGGNNFAQFTGTIAGSHLHDVVVENTGGGGVVDLTNATFAGGGSQGILLQNVNGNVNFQGLSVANTAGSGVEIDGGTGQFQFLGTTTVSNAGGPAIVVQNLGSGGNVTFGSINIAQRHDEGLVIDNAAAATALAATPTTPATLIPAGMVTVNGTTTITNENTSTASAIDIKNSAGPVNFNGAVNVTNATGNPGVSLQNDTGTTTFKSLNISSAYGTALFANNAGTLVINAAQNTATGGTISASNGTAIDIENTAMNVNLFSVSSSNATVGLKLISAPGQFAVFGNSNETAASGGTIQGATTAGIILQDVGTVGLVSMNLISNAVGVQTTNTNYLALTNVQVNNSSTFGIDALDTRTLSVLSSSFVGNGSNNIRAQVDRVDSYAYTIGASNLSSASGDNVLVQTLAGGEGATVNLVAQSDTFKNVSMGTAGINMNWSGTLAATVNQNAFLVTGGSNYGLRVNNNSTSGLTTVGFANNTFTSAGGGDTALFTQASGPSQISVASNAIQFGATNGTGLRFALGQSSTVNITGNAIVDNTDGLTGILFDSISAPGTVNISNNIIQMANNGALLTRGIVFSNVTDTTQGSVTNMLTLFGTQDNVVQGANTPVFVPTGTTTGEISVNQTLFP